MLVAIVELGLLFSDYHSLGRSVEAAARTGAVVAPSADADRQLLRSFDAVSGLDAGSVVRVVVFHATAVSPVPSPSCRSGVPSGTAGEECNVYTGADFDRPAGDFGCRDQTATDGFWCPTTRMGQGGEMLGVEVVLRRRFVTGIIPGSVTLTVRTVAPLELS